MRDENTNDRKVEKLQNVSHFFYFLDRFILQTAFFITLVCKINMPAGINVPPGEFSEENKRAPQTT